MRILLLRRVATSTGPVLFPGRSGVAGGVCLVRLAFSALGEIVKGAASENEDGDEGEEWELLAVASSWAGRWAIGRGLCFA